jgi:hypothetical protein
MMRFPFCRQPAVAPAGPVPFGSPESVIECLAIMREVAEEQRGRSRHLDAKAGTVAGFAATALTLNLTLGRPELLQHFGGPAHAWIRDFFLGSAVMFAAAAAVVLFGVLRPMSTDDLDETAIDGYADRPKVVTPPADLRLTWLQTVSRMALSDRAAGNVKATRSNVAAMLLALGVVGLLGQALVLGVAS